VHRSVKLAVAAAGVAAALALSACTVGSSSTTEGGAGADGKTVTLTFLTFETPNLTPAYWDAAIARASAKVPGVTIKKIVAPSNSVDNLRQLYASGQAPDIMTSLPPDGFAQNGQLAEWTEEDLKDFAFPRASTIDGKVYALPFSTQPIPLVYFNKKYFADAGITAAPKTYAEFLQVCAALKAKGITPIEIGGGGKDTWAASFSIGSTVATDVLATDPQWFSKRVANSVKFSDPTFVKAAQKVTDLAAQGYFDKAGLSRSYADTEQAFRDGKAAMYPMGSWFAASADSKKPSFEVGVFGWPSDDGRNIVPAVTGGGLMVNSKAADVALAKKWALAFQLDKDNLDAVVKADGALVAVKGYTPPAGLGPVYDATVALYQQAITSNAVVPAWMNTAGDGSLLPGFADHIAAGSVDLISGRKTPAAFAAFLDEQWAKASR
jgi:ABC-type glycerol-3-phosphate transport system substrate-binding protein